MNDDRTPETRIYRGHTLEEILPRIREELGPDALVTRQRTGLYGGVGGFFQRRFVEVEARASRSAGTDVVVGDDLALPAPLAETPSGDETDVRALLDALEDDFAAVLSRAADDEPGLPELAMPELAMPELAMPDLVGPEADPVPPPRRAPADEPVPALATGAMALAPSPAAQAHRDTLVAHGLPATLADAVLEDAVLHLKPVAADGGPKRLVRRALARRITVHAPSGARRRIAVVGAPGAGKSTLAAALEAAYAAGPLPVCRTTPAAVTGDEPGVLIVDCPGLAPQAGEAVVALAERLAALAVDEVHVALPATTGAAAAREQLAALAPLRPCAIALTHADSTAQHGCAVGLAVEAGLPLSYVAGDPGGDVPLVAADPGAVAARVLP